MFSNLLQITKVSVNKRILLNTGLNYKATLEMSQLNYLFNATVDSWINAPSGSATDFTLIVRSKGMPGTH